MAKPSIFISHSAKDEFAQQVRDAISDKLIEEGFDVLMDKERLAVGDEWRKMIKTWIQASSAAVILFSKDALDSKWVAYEATTLVTRKDEEPTFDVLPVRLPTVTREDLTKGTFAPLYIGELQTAKGDTVDEIVKQVLERLISLKEILAEGPLYKFVHRIGFWLKKDCDRAVWQDLATELGVAIERWPLNVNYRRLLIAQELLKAEQRAMIQALKVLAPSSCVSREEVFGIVKIITALWVGEEAAKAIPEVAKRPPTRRAICVNGCKQLIGLMYILRASSDFPGWSVLTVNTEVGEEEGKVDAGAIAKQIREAYKAEIEAEEIEDADIERRLASTEEWDDPFFVLVNGYLPQEVLLILQQRYPALTFFILSGDKPLDPEQLRVNGIEFLLPKLKRTQEESATNLYLKALEIAKKSKPR